MTLEVSTSVPREKKSVTQNTPDTSQIQVDSQASSLEDRGPASATDLIFFQM